MGINKKSKEYKQGLVDGYNKGQRDAIKIHKEGKKNIKEIRGVIERLRRISL